MRRDLPYPSSVDSPLQRGEASSAALGLEPPRRPHTARRALNIGVGLFMQIALLTSANPVKAAVDAASPELQIVLPAPSNDGASYSNYFPQLLRLALEKTKASDGPYRIDFYAAPLSSSRQILELKNNGVINLIWDGTDKQRESELLPIKVSLLRQLNDYRVFLIRREDKEKFAAVRSLDDLRRLSAGSGQNWPSTAVLRANGLPGETSPVHKNLFAMLAAKRFDYFPRGIHEAWSEQESHGDMSLVLEPTLMFHYVVPVYFFVNRSRPDLADRIHRGLNLAIKDGSFDELFLSVPSFKRGMAEIKANQRRVFELAQP